MKRQKHAAFPHSGLPPGKPTGEVDARALIFWRQHQIGDRPHACRINLARCRHMHPVHMQHQTFTRMHLHMTGLVLKSQPDMGFTLGLPDQGVGQVRMGRSRTQG